MVKSTMVAVSRCSNTGKGCGRQITYSIHEKRGEKRMSTAGRNRGGGEFNHLHRGEGRLGEAGVGLCWARCVLCVYVFYVCVLCVSFVCALCALRYRAVWVCVL